MKEPEIKVGQIYKVDNTYTDENCIFIITLIDGNDICFISNKGYTTYRDKVLIEEDIKDKYIKLLAEYPTWKEAINSKEFEGKETNK